MSEAIPQSPLTTPMPNPLHDSHTAAEAEMQNYGELEIVSTFGEPQAEYSAIRKTAGMIDMPYRGILQLTGKDRLTFLNNLITNQTFDKQTKTPLAAGSGVYAFLLGAKNGRVIADLNVLELGERTLLELDARRAEAVRHALLKYQFSEQVKIENMVGILHEIALHGPSATEVLGKAFDAGSVPEQQLGCANARMIGHNVVVWRDDPCGVPGYFLILPTDHARAVWMHLLTTFGAPGVSGAAVDVGRRKLRPIGWAAFNATRIEGGRPLFGIDFDETLLPAETGQITRAVSFTKGCYPGQEIVARMHARQQVAKQIVGIRMEGDALPIAGTHIFDDAGNQVGGITSSTMSPILSNAAICLGLVKRPFFNLGTALNIPAEGATRKGAVVALPFLR